MVSVAGVRVAEFGTKPNIYVHCIAIRCGAFPNLIMLNEHDGRYQSTFFFWLFLYYELFARILTA